MAVRLKFQFFFKKALKFPLKGPISEIEKDLYIKEDLCSDH